MSRAAQVVEQAAVADAGPCAKPRRADAERNRQKLITAAREAFADAGDASLEGIAKRAGVGIGTLYRNFADRRELLEAVYVEEVESLCKSAADFADEPPWDALTGWLDRYVGYVTTKHALLEEMISTLGEDSDRSVFSTCHQAITTAGEPLVKRAQQAGAVRDDVEFLDVIRLVSGVASINYAPPEQVRQLLGVALDGLRYRG